MNNIGQIVKAKGQIPFTQVPNEFLQNPKISLKAKGLLSYLLSFPESWVHHKTNLTRGNKDGKESIKSAWDELVELGYIVSVRIIGENNLTKGWNHVVYAFPCKNEDDKIEVDENPRQIEGSSESGFPDIREPEDTKTRNYKETVPYKEKEIHINGVDAFLLQEFRDFMALYPGTKRGLETEFRQFKKHRDWKEVLPILKTSVENYIAWRSAQMMKAGVFVPAIPHLSTWINQRRWETVYESVAPQTAKPPQSNVVEYDEDGDPILDF